MTASRLLIIGNTGMLGRDIEAEARTRLYPVETLAGPDEIDITDDAAVRAAMTRLAPSIVVNATGYTDVDGAEAAPDEADLVNRVGPAHLAAACRACDAMLVHYSTDYVFDGRGTAPYAVDATAAPTGVYGRTKRAGERAIIDSGCRHLLVRTSWLFASHGRNFVRTILERSRERPSLDVVNDQHGRPTHAPDLARMTFDLLEADAEGIFHAANDGDCTWFDLAAAIVELAGIDCTIRPCPTSAYPRPAPRPAYSVLDLSATSALIGPVRHWTDALEDCLARLTGRRVTPCP